MTRLYLGAGNQLLVPASVYAEVLVGPLRNGVEQIVDEFIEDTRLELISLDRALARRAAGIRARNNALRLPDALVLATAIEHEATLLTLDTRLRRAADDLG